jgi:hypothetical protein
MRRSVAIHNSWDWCLATFTLLPPVCDSAVFLNACWQSCSVRLFSTASPQLRQDGGLSVLSAIGETQESMVGGWRGPVRLISVKKSRA